MVNAWKKSLTGVLIGSVTAAIFVVGDSLLEPGLINTAIDRMRRQGNIGLCQNATGCPDPGWSPVVIAAILSLVMAAVAGFLLLLVLRYSRKKALKICISGVVVSCMIIGLILLLPHQFYSVFNSGLEFVVGLFALALAYWVPVMRFGDTAPVKK